jgi:hypothetical protein
MPPSLPPAGSSDTSGLGTPVRAGAVFLGVKKKTTSTSISLSFRFGSVASAAIEWLHL